MRLVFILVMFLPGCAADYSDHWRDCVYQAPVCAKEKGVKNGFY